MLHMVSLMCQKMARELLLNWECHSENITRYWVICGNVTNVPFKLTWVTLQKKKSYSSLSKTQHEVVFNSDAI